jgi:hypothetical protein
MKNLLRPAISLFVLLSIVTGVFYPLLVTGVARDGFPGCRQRQPDRQGRQTDRLRTDRPELHRAEVLLGPAIGNRTAAL